MNVVFPFGLPAPTAFYLTLFVLTFVLHQAFMHYVLAGCLYVTWTAVWPGRGSVPRSEQPLAATLRDWMPFLLSAAITAGVAPLLFIQIVYQKEFYTANLLLWWRWMLVVPVLIVAFYSLYLMKSSFLWRCPYLIRVAVTVITSASFLFVGFSWSVNHLLANRAGDWANVYATGSLPFTVGALVARMLIWIGGSFATMAAIVGWQLLYRQEFSGDQSEIAERQVANPQRDDAVKSSASKGLDLRNPVTQERHSGLIAPVHILAGLAGGGLCIALIAGVAYIVQCDSETRGALFGYRILPYVLIAVVGVVIQGVGWAFQWRRDRFGAGGLTAVAAGAGLCLLGVSVQREAVRMQAIDLAALAPRHSEATTVGGFAVFIAAAIFVSLLIAWCVRIVQKGGNSVE